MLDAETKRRIDTARDVLVGKIPDPKSQVEQITIALIYKFMDDMDAESELAGGNRKFFAGDYARYGWAKLMHSGLGGQEILNLYAEAITKMPENPGIPPLFRSIFKNAYLPYRDPETLRMFLKIIDEFAYDHSERLGDAFEYLLSVLGSQGEAGQFRTPRHIIDFIVSVVDPKKNETILDPACGTAGFLISSYKHILRANTNPEGQSTLTPDENKRIAQNLKGYDISPDMERLSLVNMYLHGFTDPHIYEYDTLTSTEKWNEYADVILANPPFMSPKGGIKPHKQFSIQSKRSEVLFVDYMAEHLTPNGRAGIIVPEGIIFQSQTAYKDLRKMLVENYLVAVLSLPAGVFNPYSGVKTSILILDRVLAKQCETIGFFKIENDGFGLGAQRREIEKNDIDQCKDEIAAYLNKLRAREYISDFNPALGLIVPKEKIAANGDYSLSGERYRENGIRHSVFPLHRFEEVCTLEYGSSLTKEKRIEGPYPVVGSNGVTGYHNEYIVEGPAIIVGRKGSAGEVTLINQNCFPIDTTYYVRRIDQAKSDIVYLYWVLKGLNLSKLRDGAGIPGLNRTDVYKSFQIPLPPLEVQKEIVAEIEGYQKVIDGARAVVENYRPHIQIDPEWPVTELQRVCVIRSGGTPDRSNESFWNGDIPWVTTTLINYSVIDQANEFITSKGLKDSSTWIVPRGTVLMAMYGQGVTRGRVALLGIDAAINQACAAFQVRENSLNPNYLYRILQSRYEDLRKISDARGGNQSNLSAQVLKQYLIPLPPLDIQQRIVAEIEAEQALVAANRELIERFEKKIQATIARVWGEEEKTKIEKMKIEKGKRKWILAFLSATA